MSHHWGSQIIVKIGSVTELAGSLSVHLEIQGWIASLGIHHRLSDSPPLLELTQTPPHPGFGMQGSPSFWGGRQGPAHFWQPPWGIWRHGHTPGKGKSISESFELWPIPDPTR